MKKLSTFSIICLSLTACVSSPRYVPQTMFPQGSIEISHNVNRNFSTPLHKFVELTFFNDNKEWVEIEDLELITSEERPSEILTDQARLDQWLSSRAEEKMRKTTSSARSASLGFAILGLGAVIAEVASNSYDNDASLAAFAASDLFAIAAAAEAESTLNEIDSTLANTPLSSKIALPPGQALKKWFVINTPEDNLPNQFFITYTAKGQISGFIQPGSAELTNNRSASVSQRPSAR